MFRKGASLLKTIVFVVVFLILTAMVLHTSFSWIPRNLQDVEGTELIEGEQVVDLKQRLEQALEQSYEVAITEAELNQYIASKLQLTHSPIIDDYVSIKGVYVDIKPNLLDISIEREIDYPQNLQEDGSKKVSFLPLTHTVSIQLKVTTEENAKGEILKTIHFPGSHFGQAPAPGLFTYLVKSGFKTVADFFADEVDLAYQQMASLKVEEGVIRLDPKVTKAVKQ